MGEFAIGQPVSRLEDPRLLKGLGRYIDDLNLPGQAHAFILRSPHAHARILAIDASGAASMPGVLGVLTGADCEADGLGHLPCDQKRFRRDGGDMYRPPRPILVRDRVRVVGDYVAMVVAETAALARDAAEAVAVDYEPLPAVISPADAAEEGAPRLWDDCPGNECFFHEDGDAAAVEAAFSAADFVVERRFTISRVTAAPIGPRGCIGEYDPSLERYTLRTGVQQAHMLRMHIARTVFGIPETRMRVIAPDIGGSFGLYSNVYPENVLVLWAARRFGRPVKWSADRSECMLSDDSARDCVSDAALALDSGGRFLALRCRTYASLGAYLSLRGPLPPVVNLGTLAGTYTTPAIHVRVSGMFTNTFCTSPYRGAGRPEASTVLEQLVDEAARRLAIDPAEIRRRNTIPADAMPYRTALTFTYDSGDFRKNLDDALALAGHDGFEARRGEAASRGRLRGIGISNTVHRASGLELEAAQIRFDATGTATLMVGSVHHGQGHATTFTQIACDIVEAHGGRIRAASDGPGLGARFTFTLPVDGTGGAGGLAAPAPRSSRQSRRAAGDRVRVLAVDDDPQDLRYVRDALIQSGYTPLLTGDPEEAVRLMEEERPQLALLDLLLPGTDGIELMERITDIANVPVIFLSAFGRDEIIARAIEMGAVDYLTKPFSQTELTARIGSALRRRELSEPSEPYVLGDLTIDYAAHRVTLAGRPVQLTATEYRMLAELSASAGRVVTYEHLLERIWGEKGGSDLSPMRTIANKLRAKLGEDARNPTYIFTESRVGYRMPRGEPEGPAKP